MASYFYEDLGVLSIPNFLRAESPQALRRLMLRTNRKMKGYVKYSTPQYVESEGRWYVWYVVKVEDELAVLQGSDE